MKKEVESLKKAKQVSETTISALQKAMSESESREAALHARIPELAQPCERCSHSQTGPALDTAHVTRLETDYAIAQRRILELEEALRRREDTLNFRNQELQLAQRLASDYDAQIRELTKYGSVTPSVRLQSDKEIAESIAQLEHKMEGLRLEGISPNKKPAT